MFYDPEGIVFDYVTYLLNDISKILDRLIIVCNGFIGKEGIKKLSKYSKEIINRENTGFDAAAWKEAIVNHLGKEELKDYDELALFNDSFFGPFVSFKNIFKEMESGNADFWGLSSHGAVGDKEGNVYRPRYIQLYFLTVNSRMLHSDEFFDYWQKMPLFKSFEELGEKHQFIFTKHFEDLGYSWSVYSDTSDLEDEDFSRNLSHHMFNTYEMVSKRGFPVIKRKCFTMPKSVYLRYGKADTLRLAFDYIKENGLYDVGLIWDYLLAKYNVRDIHESLDLVRVLPAYFSDRLPKDRKIAVTGYLFYDDQFDYYVERLFALDIEIDVYLVTDTTEKKKKLEKKTENRPNWHILHMKHAGRDLAALLIDLKGCIRRYDYVCFFHDKKSYTKEHITVSNDFRDLLIDNTLYGRNYVRNITNAFEKDPRLGVMVPPGVFHGSYFYSQANYWTECYEGTKNLLAMLGVDVPLSEDKAPLSLGTCLWFRPEALLPLWKHQWKESDFSVEPFPRDGSISHCLERAFPYIAQSQGYYTETVMNDRYAGTEIADYRYMLENTVKAVTARERTDLRSFESFERSVSRKGVSGISGLFHGPLYESLKKTARKILPYETWMKLRYWKNRHE